MLNKWSGRTDEGAKRPILQLPAVHVYSQRGARGVHGAHGAVFCDIENIHATINVKEEEKKHN